MNINVTKLDSFNLSDHEKKNGCNALRHDFYHMGQGLGIGLVMLFDKHPSEVMTYFILVDTKTGERYKIDISNLGLECPRQD